MTDLFDRSDSKQFVSFGTESHVDRYIDGSEPFVQTDVVGTLRLLEAFKAYPQSQVKDRQRSFRFITCILKMKLMEVEGRVPDNFNKIGFEEIENFFKRWTEPLWL